MTRSHQEFDLAEKLQERGYSREQVTMGLDIADVVVSVSERGTTLLKRLLPMRPERVR